MKDIIAILTEAKEEIEYVMECDAERNPVYSGCPRQQRLIQKLEAAINDSKIERKD